MFNFVCAALVFCGAVAAAIYIPQWNAILTDSSDAFTVGLVNRVVAAAGAAAVSYVCSVWY